MADELGDWAILIEWLREFALVFFYPHWGRLGPFIDDFVDDCFGSERSKGGGAIGKEARLAVIVDGFVEGSPHVQLELDLFFQTLSAQRCFASASFFWV